MIVASLFVALAVLQSATDGLGDLFLGIGGCLAVADDQSLSEGTRLVVLAADQRAAEIPAETAQSPRKGSDCVRKWREGPPPKSRLVRVGVPAILDDEVVFAVQSGPNLRVRGGPPIKLSAREAERWSRVAAPSLTTPWRAKDVLVHAYRYGPAGRQAAVELYVGRPMLNPRGSFPPIQAISIRRLFLIGGRVLASEEYERVSAREERVDTEPPKLTFANWSVSETERTVAFISTDKGESWRRLSTDIGFEGINWIAQALRVGLPEERWFLYTSH